MRTLILSFFLVILLCMPVRVLSAEGDPDPFFGQSGVVTFNRGVNDAAQAVARQSDGKVVIAGTVSNGSNTDVLVLRLTADGRRDTSFGLNGVVTFDTGNDDSARGVAVQTDGKIVVVGQTSNGTDNDILVLRWDSNGLPDPTFNLVGAATFDLGNDETANAVAVQTNNRIVIAGTASNGSNNDFLVMRLDTNGSPDITFNAGGFLTLDRGGRDIGNAVAVQANGLIVAVGASSNGSNSDLMVVRLTADGFPDISFSLNGIFTLDRGGGDIGNAVAVQTNGLIVVAGESSNGSNADLMVVRLTAGGFPDVAFSLNGIFTLDRGGSDSGNALVLQPNGKILVVGSSSSGTDEDCITVRLNPDGTRDTSFSADGISIIQGAAGGDDSGNAVAVQFDGKILVAGEVSNGRNTDLLVLRYTPEGVLDSSFNGDGIFTFSSKTKTVDAATAVALQPNGRIVVAGRTGSGSAGDLLVLRYKTNGTLDRSFSNDGIAVYSGDSGSEDIGRAVAIQNDGKAVVAGQTSNGANSDLLVLRYKSDGSLDTSFSGDGVAVYSGAADSNDIGRAVAIQDDGKIVVVGQTSNGANNNLLILRYTSSGSLDTTFGTAGVVNFGGSGNESGRSVVIQPNGMIVVAGVRSNGADTDLLLLRYTESGSLDTTFGSGGVVAYDSGNADAANAIALQPDGKIVVVGASDDDVLVLRYIGQKVSVLSPQGGEVLKAGDPLPFDITWTAPPKAVFFTIELSVDGGMTWRILAQNVTGSTWPWAVTVPIGNKRACLIRVTGYDANKVKVNADRSATFAIEVLKLVQPDGGELFSSGDPVNITWTTHNTKRTVASVKLLYTLNGGNTWLRIPAAISGDPGSFAWTAPSVPKAKKKVKVKVVLKDENNKTVGKDASDTYFTIQP